jgi:HSP20 family protein
MNLPSLFRGTDDFWTNDPFTRIEQMQREMDRAIRSLQREAHVPAGWSATLNAPSCDVKEADGHYLVAMDIPGMNKDDIKIELADNRLSVSGERKEEKEEKKKGTFRSERFYGSFERTFTLPEGVKSENIATEYKDGVLRIAIPKTEASKPKQIKVGEAKPGFFDRFFKKDQKTIEVKDANKVA